MDKEKDTRLEKRRKPGRREVKTKVGKENGEFEKFTETFARLCTKYAEYVEAKVQASSQIVTEPALVEPVENAVQLMEEVRAVNVLAVTMGRMEALKTGKQFGNNAGI